MDQAVANLKTARYTLSTKVLEACQNPRPSYNVEGQDFDFKDYLKMLLDGIKMLLELISSMEPFNISSMAVWYSTQIVIGSILLSRKK